VVGVDAATATVLFADGTSKHRRQIDPNIHAQHGRHSAFRFLVREEEVLADPVTAEFFAARNSMDLWYAEKRKVVIYRCANNELLNFVCFHPKEQSSVATDSYSTMADQSLLLDIFHDFDPRLVAMLRKADPKSLRVYPLFDMEPLETFVKDKLALLGDAAHPFLPHLGQGGAMAIEDGISLGVMLSNLASVEDIPARLRLYNEARYERATLVQTYTRIVGGDGLKSSQTSTSDLSGKCPARRLDYE